jgi:protein TonB
MTHMSGAAKIVALSIALVAHGAFALTLVAPEAARIDGAGGAGEVRLGSGFQDLATGTLNPEQADMTKPETPGETLLVEPPDRTETGPTEPIAAERPDIATAAERPATMAQGPAQTTPAQPPVTAITPAPEDVAETETPPLSAPLTPDGTLTAERPQTIQKDTAQPQTAEASPDRLQSSEPDSTTLTRSLRPVQRSAAFVETHRPAPVAKPARKPAAQAARPKSAQGNADQNAVAGAASGTKTATARQTGAGGQQQANGNAAASNYPGLVLRKLSRAGKPRVNARGAAMVSFTVSSSGNLASVSLARSSGSSALDKAAVRLVQGAGPFPKPPQGARRTFAIEIKGS